MPVSHPETLQALQSGKMTLQGEFLWGSNYTFLAAVETDSQVLAAVYKPTQGERPLWDFPPATLGRREVAAYQVSQALGWELVPPTIYRAHGPLGPGSVQLFIEHDPEYHYFNFNPDDRDGLRPVVVFDLLINNADRKGSHILFATEDHHLWLIDHGICFHEEDKLRTVVWDFVGEPIPDHLCADLAAFQNRLESQGGNPSELFSSLTACLKHAEIQALAQRAGNLVVKGIFPAPDPHRRPYPWPQI